MFTSLLISYLVLQRENVYKNIEMEEYFCLSMVNVEIKIVSQIGICFKESMN